MNNLKLLLGGLVIALAASSCGYAAAQQTTDDQSQRLAVCQEALEMANDYYLLFLATSEALALDDRTKIGTYDALVETEKTLPEYHDKKNRCL